MKKSIKIILVISIISILSFIMIIPSFAIDYPDVIEFHNGDEIVLKNNISTSNIGYFDIQFITEASNVYQSTIKWNISDLKYGNTTVYNLSSGWLVQGNNTLKIRENKTLSDTSQIKWFYDNAVSAPWIVPNPMESAYDNTNNFLTASLNYLKTITSYITSNIVLTVIIIGLAIVSITVSLLTRLNRKKFK